MVALISKRRGIFAVTITITKRTQRKDFGPTVLSTHHHYQINGSFSDSPRVAYRKTVEKQERAQVMGGGKRELISVPIIWSVIGLLSSSLSVLLYFFGQLRVIEKQHQTHSVGAFPQLSYLQGFFLLYSDSDLCNLYGPKFSIGHTIRLGNSSQTIQIATLLCICWTCRNQSDLWKHHLRTHRASQRSYVGITIRT